MFKNKDIVLLSNKKKIFLICKKIKLEGRTLEIGPGTGNLTIGILNKIKSVNRFEAVEKDPLLASILIKRTCINNKIKVTVTDIIRYPISKFVTVVGNIPYSISNSILRKLAIEGKNIKYQYLMLQREVFETLCDKGNFKGKIFTTFYKIKKLVYLLGEDFRPNVKVQSVFLKMVKKEVKINKVLKDFIFKNYDTINYKEIFQKQIGRRIKKNLRNVRSNELMLFYALIFKHVKN
ncbi:rRNA adenine N-6-methyltransferase family protein [Candidatus Vidania fulgoroideorum]